MKSVFGMVNISDVARGLIVAALSAALTALAAIVNAGALPSMGDWKGIALTGIAGGLAYLTKNFFTNSEDKMFTGEK